VSSEIALPSADELEGEEIRRSLYAFILSAWPVVEPATPFRANWHIDAICEHLEAATRGEIRRLLITIPPRHMKTLQVAVFWPAWVWLSHPERRFLYASYAQSLSINHTLICRRLIQSAGIDDPGKPGGRTLLERIGYGRLVELIWGEEPWSLRDDDNRKARFENTRTGFRLATSVGGTVTGEGGDFLVLDDPHKPEEAQSDAVRESVIDWHDSTWTTRLNDAETGVQVIVMQRLHERDLAGHVLERGGWEHLCLPAEYEPHHPCAWPRDPRTEPGEVLWEKWGQPWLAEKRRDLGSYGYAGQYQQRPAPAEGGILKRAWWRYYDPEAPLPHFEEIIQSWDMAFSDTDRSDYVVGQVWGRFKGDKYLLRQVRARMEFTDTVHAVRELTGWVERSFPRHRSHTKLVEDKANGPAVVSTLRREIPGLVAVPPRGDKVARARAVAPELESGNVYLPGHSSADGQGYDRGQTPAWVQGFVDECASFPNGAYDDQVDALTQALVRLAGGGSTRWRQRSRGRTIVGPLLDMEL
jgi:predicted phage terminase large subunit-like protein